MSQPISELLSEYPNNEMYEIVNRELPEALFLDQVWDEFSFEYKGQILGLSAFDYDCPGVWEEQIDRFLEIVDKPMNSIYKEIVETIRSQSEHGVCNVKDLTWLMKEKRPSVVTLEVRAALIALYDAGHITMYDENTVVLLDKAYEL